MKRLLVSTAIAIGALAVAGSASAAVTLTVGSFGGPLGVHSVPGQSAGTVLGTVTSAPGPLVTLSTTGDLLDTSGGGEAIFAANDGSMNDLSILFSQAYLGVTFNLNVPVQTTSTMTLSVNGGAFNFAVPNALIPDPLGNGANKFILWATGGDTITSLDFTFTPGVQDIRQIRVADGISPIPEPATWAMMIIGFGAAGAMLRSNRRRMAFAAI
ncbi:PEPxxWA-CTERM sorting domain-containing protein [Phenylobacterium sp. LH3H17]|nr:PEPxxWA-CTERM sorting domain-containing protein [Phenylobacterium sp. LH3H17]UTP38049.1 PEPxxWA-CTERM sorting domain-containing protein [Phenylobacterium sp. LH3H17]